MPAESSDITQRFVTHGNFVVMPLCFPSVTAPIDPDESFVTALAVHSDGVRVIGGTSGRRAHLFEAAPKPVGGYVCDMGAVDGAVETVKVLTLQDRAIACVNTQAGGKVMLQWVMGRMDGIQEWSRSRPEAETLTELREERLCDAWIAPDGEWLLLLTERRVLRVSLKGCQTRFVWHEKPEPVEAREAEALDGGEVSEPCISRFGVTVDGEVFAALQGGTLLRIGERIEETGLALPFSTGGWGWAASPDGRLLAADQEGRLFAVDIPAKRVEELGRTLIAPLKCMACLPDGRAASGPSDVARHRGRAYGFCGEGIGRFFLLDIGRKTVTDLGAVAGVLGTKRYANTFSCAVTGPDGEIYFGEDDRGGCLWLYFPPVVAR